MMKILFLTYIASAFLSVQSGVGWAWCNSSAYEQIRRDVKWFRKIFKVSISIHIICIIIITILSLTGVLNHEY